MTEAEETAEAKEIAKKQEETPLNIDIKEAISEYGSEEIKDAVSSKEVNVEKAVKTGLSFYQDLIYTSDFYKERDTSKDFELINVDRFTDRMDASLIADIENSINETGKLDAIFVMDSKGGFAYEDKSGKKHTYTATQIPASNFNTPAISMTDSGSVRIDGWRNMTLPVKDDTLLIKQAYAIEVLPVNDKEFIVSSLGWSIDTNAGGIENVGK